MVDSDSVSCGFQETFSQSLLLPELELVFPKQTSFSFLLYWPWLLYSQWYGSVPVSPTSTKLMWLIQKILIMSVLKRLHPVWPETISRGTNPGPKHQVYSHLQHYLVTPGFFVHLAPFLVTTICVFSSDNHPPHSHWD